MVATEALSPPDTGGLLCQFPSTSVPFGQLRVNRGHLEKFRFSATSWEKVRSVIQRGQRLPTCLVRNGSTSQY